MPIGHIERRSFIAILRRKRPILVMAALLAAFATYWLLFEPHKPHERRTSFQGYMEGDLVLVGPEDGGRISKVFVEEGANIEAGKPLYALDATYETEQLHQAEGLLTQSQSELDDLLSEQMRSEEIDVLQAKLRTAEAAVRLSEADFRRKKQLFERGVIPQSTLDASQSAYERDKAALAEATAQITVGHLSARKEQVAAARAKVAAATATAQQAKSRLDKRTIKAPVAGRVEELNYRAGEVVTTGQPVVGLLPPENVKARFFVPEPDRSRIKLGTPVSIGCDGCPAGLKAHIVFIARQAEYTPPVIYGPKERAKLVFRAEARLVGSQVSLDPGQPVTVSLEVATES
jgi:HlyD family secretion protein